MSEKTTRGIANVYPSKKFVLLDMCIHPVVAAEVLELVRRRGIRVTIEIPEEPELA
jgi:hypothetical protein